MFRFKRHRKFTISNRLALGAALVLCVTALAGGTREMRDDSPFNRAVDAIAQQATGAPEDATPPRRGLKASFLLLRGR